MKDKLHRLAWDSDFFGFGVGRADCSIEHLPRVIQHASTEGMRLLYWTADAVDAALAVPLRVGATLVDRKVTFSMPVPTGTVGDGIRTATQATPGLHSLALQSGHRSRYRVDPKMPEGTFERLYATWLDRSVSGAIAREVLVYGEDQGFITLGDKAGRLDIGLLAVDSSVRSQGIGAKLVSAAFARAREWGYSHIQVVTQTDNEGACRFYRRCGFRVESVQQVHHVWV